MKTLISNKYYSISKDENGRFVAELSSLALCGVEGFNFKLDDTVQDRLQARVDKVVDEALNPRDPVLRKLTVRPQQQDLIS